MERETCNSRDHPPSPPLPEHVPGVTVRREAAPALSAVSLMLLLIM